MELGGGGQVGADGRSLGGGGDELLHHADAAVMGCGGGARDGASSPAPHMLRGGDSGASQGAGRAGGCTGGGPRGRAGVAAGRRGSVPCASGPPPCAALDVLGWVVAAC